MYINLCRHIANKQIIAFQPWLGIEDAFKNVAFFRQWRRIFNATFLKFFVIYQALDWANYDHD